MIELLIFLFLSYDVQVSWCKFEITVDSPKDVCSSTSKTLPEIPSVIVTAINLKTMSSEKHNSNEIVSASIICCHQTKVSIFELISSKKEE